MRISTDKNMLWFAISLSACLIFMTVHSLIYNWIFLPNLFAGKEMPFTINEYVITKYWEWPTGKILIVMNLIFLLLPFIILKWSGVRNRR